MTGSSRLLTSLRSLARRRAVVIGVALALVLSIGAAARRVDDQTFTAHFQSATGIYPGDEVRILGVPVGTIESVDPRAEDVAVKFRLHDGVKVPAGAQAVIVAPSLVSSRYVQLTPQYSAGPVLRDGATIPLERTAVPVEFDRIKHELSQIATDFGPRGLNKDGSLATFVTTASKALDGRGNDINRTIAELSRTVHTLSTGRDDIFTTVRELQKFVTLMAQSEAQIREFGTRLETVSGVLAENRTALKEGLAALQLTVVDVQRFVQAHRGRLVTTTKGLSDVLAIVARERQHVEHTLHTGPSALHNLVGAFHSKENALAVGLQLTNTHNLQQLVCGALGALSPAAQALAAACTSQLGPLLAALSGELPLSTELLQAIEESLGVTGR